jgi:hypothetical protein
MTEKNKIWKTGILLVISLTFLMMTAASVNADRINVETVPVNEEIVINENTSENDEGNLISPGPEEPLIIAPNPNLISENIEQTDDLVIAGDTTGQNEILNIGLPGLAIITILAGIAICIIVYKIKK